MNQDSFQSAHVRHNSLRLDLARHPKILVGPLLRLRPPLLLWLADRTPCLDLPAQHNGAEAVAQEIALWFEEAKGVAEFLGEGEFEGWCREPWDDINTGAEGDKSSKSTCVYRTSFSGGLAPWRLHRHCWLGCPALKSR